MTTRFAAGALAWLLIGAASSAWADSPAPIPPAPSRPALIINPDWDRKPTGDDLANAYPPRARAAGVQGETRIQCGVGVDGALDDCVLLYEAPTGWGFGEAAMEIAPRFRMKPKTIDGQPVGSGKVIIPVAWRMDTGKPAVLYTPTPEDLALARRLQKALRADLASGLLANFYGSGLAPALARMDAERAGRLTAAWKVASIKLREDLAEREAQALAQVYSHQELSDITAFLESSSGQAFMTRMPDVWRLAAADTRGPFLAFIEAWRAGYCAETTCDDADQTLFERIRRQAEGLPGPR